MRSSATVGSKRSRPWVGEGVGGKVRSSGSALIQLLAELQQGLALCSLRMAESSDHRLQGWAPALAGAVPEDRVDALQCMVGVPASAALRCAIEPQQVPSLRTEVCGRPDCPLFGEGFRIEAAHRWAITLASIAPLELSGGPGKESCSIPFDRLALAAASQPWDANFTGSQMRPRLPVRI